MFGGPCKTPFLNPIFQGFNSFRSNSSYLGNATDAKLTSSFDSCKMERPHTMQNWLVFFLSMQNGETP